MNELQVLKREREKDETRGLLGPAAAAADLNGLRAVEQLDNSEESRFRLKNILNHICSELMPKPGPGSKSVF